MNWGLIFALLVLLSACGGGSAKYQPENPYAERMQELSKSGVAAMQRERWDVAQKLFERALKAAQLANDPHMVASAWYNLGMAYASAGDQSRSEDALQQAVAMATRHHLDIVLARASVALALRHQKQGKKAWAPAMFSSRYPADIHLSAARLAQLQKRYGIAEKEYDYVLRKKENSRAVALYKIEAHMGMALLALERHDRKMAMKESDIVLELSRQHGAPRLAAHAMLFQARLAGNQALRQSRLQDARVIYQVLNDIRGQHDVLTELLLLAKQRQNEHEVRALELQLQELGQ